MLVRQTPVDGPDTVREAKMTLAVEGQLAGKAVEEFNGLTAVEHLKIPK